MIKADCTIIFTVCTHHFDISRTAVNIEMEGENRMNKKLISSILAVGMLTGTIASAADFGIGAEYRTEEDAKAKAETQSLFDSRPGTLKQAEDLDRGLTAVPSKDGGILVSWRYLGTDRSDVYAMIYRNGEFIAKVSDTTNYVDKDGKGLDTYKVLIFDGTSQDNTESSAIDTDECTAWEKEYISIPVVKYEEGNYTIDDASVGDLDGDGEYEIVIRRTPANYFDQLQVDESGRVIDSRVAYPLIEAYEMDGTHLWTMDIGKNEANDIDINFLVYDINGDGKAEVTMRSYDGMTDGTGAKIGIADADYTQSLQKQKDRQYLAEGNEYLSVFDGQTGKEIARTDLLPKRDPLSSWSSNYSDTSRLTKRASHYLLTTAYLNGETPSIVMMRGAWDAVKLAAWDFKDGEFTELWQYDSGASSKTDNLFGAGYHSLAVADIDFDGKDEILSGAGAIDDNGEFMYATYAEQNGEIKLGHGDAFDVAKMDPNYDGYYIWSCHETKELPANIDLHDARTGQVIYGFNKPKDTGRSRAADIDPTSEGWEVWGSTGTPLLSLDGTPLITGVAEKLQPELDNKKLQLGSGETLADGWNTFKYRKPDGTFLKDDETGLEISTTLPMNFKAFWDGDLLSELVDNITISKYNWEDKCVDILYDAYGCASNGGSKAVPCLAADIFGDWREEIIWRNVSNTELRIYATPYETEYKIPTLMHDITYREAVAWQNNHYNQPTNTSFYMGAETETVPAPEIKTVSGKVNPDLLSSNSNHLELPILYNNDKDTDDNVVIMKIGKAQAVSNGEVKPIDSENPEVFPFIENDRTMVPLRFIAENFGAEVEWNEETREITMTLDDTVVKMTLDNAVFTVNGEEKTLDAPAHITGDTGRTVVPVRAVLESFSKELYWNGNEQLIAIGSGVENASDEQAAQWIESAKVLQ